MGRQSRALIPAITPMQFLLRRALNLVLAETYRLTGPRLEGLDEKSLKNDTAVERRPTVSIRR